ncbi:MAG: DUF4097 domain-containing protein, partial [Gemmatimonadota bacterium]|nr:DUF4097 domain-containing protein [Gemmatimonadota bacterium]
MTHRLAVMLAGLALIVALPGEADAQITGRHEIAGNSVAIYNLAGTVTIIGGSGSDVTVNIQAGGRDQSDLRLATGSIEGIETLRVIYPSDHIVYDELRGGSRTTLRVREDGTFSDGRGDRSHADRVRITGSGSGLEAYADMEITVPAGKDVALYLGVGEVRASNVNGDLIIDVAAAPVETQNTMGTLLVDTGSGTVLVEDAVGDVDIDTGSGSVEVRSISEGSLRIDTGSGRVTGSNLNVDMLYVDTGSGGIELEEVTTTRAELDTGSGGVRLDLTGDIDDLNIDTGSGSVVLAVPGNFGAELMVETGSGGIDFEMPVMVSEFSRREIRGTIGD